MLEHYKNVLYPPRPGEEKSGESVEEVEERVESKSEEAENKAPKQKKPAPAKGTRKRKRKATGSPTKKKKHPKLNVNLINELNDSGGTTSGEDEVAVPLIELSDNSEPNVEEVSTLRELTTEATGLLRKELNVIKSACATLAANLENVLN